MGQAPRDFEFLTPGPTSPRLRADTHRFESLSKGGQTGQEPIFTDDNGWFSLSFGTLGPIRLRVGYLPMSAISARARFPLSVLLSRTCLSYPQAESLRK
jgi:hypothetical protein